MTDYQSPLKAADLPKVSWANSPPGENYNLWLESGDRIVSSDGQSYLKFDKGNLYYHGSSSGDWNSNQEEGMTAYGENGAHFDPFEGLPEQVSEFSCQNNLAVFTNDGRLIVNKYNGDADIQSGDAFGWYYITNDGGHPEAILTVDENLARITGNGGQYGSGVLWQVGGSGGGGNY